MTKIILILVVVAGLANAQEYSARVENYFQSLQLQYKSTKICVSFAKNKMKEFESKYNSNQQYAVAMVNLYTQHCRLDGGIFFSELNKDLRSGHPTPFWKTTEDLLNEGMVLLGEKTFPIVYRGDSNKEQFKPGTLYSFKQFISTSLDKSEAEMYAKPTFYSILQAQGLELTMYSKFPQESEVLLKSSSTFEVVDVTQGKYRNVVLKYV